MVGEIRALAMDEATRDAIVAHLRAWLPCEGCGLLATQDRPEGVRVVRRFYPGDNIDRSPTRYTMDPRQVMLAIEELEASGWDTGGIVHSHPRTEPVPSRTDLTEAYYAEALLLIASFAAEPPLLRAWRLQPNDAEQPFAEIEVRIGPL